MQSSQSSSTTALRAIIMLFFIVAVPLAALNGTALPDKAKKLLDQFWPTISSLIPKTNSNVTNANILSEAPTYDAKTQNLQAVPCQLAHPTANPMPQLTANNQPNVLPVQASTANVERLIPQSSDVIPASYQSTIEPRGNSQANANNPKTDANPFMAMQNRLKQLGATYYLLETWGNQRQYYRFYCQMAVGGNSSYTHYFEATNPNPMEAMGDVLRQVEAWRGGGGIVR